MAKAKNTPDILDAVHKEVELRRAKPDVGETDAKLSESEWEAMISHCCLGQEAHAGLPFHDRMLQTAALAVAAMDAKSDHPPVAAPVAMKSEPAETKPTTKSEPAETKPATRTRAARKHDD